MTRWLFASLALTLVALGATYYAFAFEYDRLPERIPIHWNAAGRADGWVDKSDRGAVLGTFLIGPGVMALFCLLSVLLPWLSPKKFEVDRFRNVFNYVMALVVVLMGYIHGVLLYGYFHPDAVLSLRWLIGGMLLFFMLLGNVLGQVRSNFWVGVRTPWTLASEVVWDRTHRVAAWLWVGFGFVGLALLLLGVEVWWLFGGLMVVTLFPVFYSLFIYKRLERQGRL